MTWNWRAIGFWAVVVAVAGVLSTLATNSAGQWISLIAAFGVGLFIARIRPIRRWLDAGSQRPASNDQPALEFTSFGFWLVVAGSLAIVVAVFLPQETSTSSNSIADNTLIQTGNGWGFVALVVIALGVMSAAYRGRRSTKSALLIGALAVGFAIYCGTSKSQLRLCSVADPSSCQEGSAGIGLYLAGLGGALIFLGGLRLVSAIPTPGLATGSEPRAATRGTKRCPDCAEDVLAEARVCKHCGYRFEGP